MINNSVSYYPNHHFKNTKAETFAKFPKIP